jgi:ribulose-phosphate 3-epimerase
MMSKTIRVIPAILTEDPKALKTMLEQSAAFTDYVQIDFMDGKFVPSHSINWQDLPSLSANIKWEAHLMIEQPAKELEHFKKVGASKAIFHYEATDDPQRVISTGRKLGLKMGIALNPETSIEKVLSLTAELESVLFLSVHPGYYGAKFIPEVLDKVAELRKARPNLVIGIDGGIKESNIAQIAKTGVDEICVGSAIFMQPQLGEAYHKLLALANG